MKEEITYDENFKDRFIIKEKELEVVLEEQEQGGTQ